MRSRVVWAHSQGSRAARAQGWNGGSGAQWPLGLGPEKLGGWGFRGRAGWGPGARSSQRPSGPTLGPRGAVASSAKVASLLCGLLRGCFM